MKVGSKDEDQKKGGGNSRQQHHRSVKSVKIKIGRFVNQLKNQGRNEEKEIQKRTEGKEGKMLIKPTG